MERSQGEPDTDAVRAELRAWLAEHLTPRWSRRPSAYLGQPREIGSLIAWCHPLFVHLSTYDRLPGGPSSTRTAE